MICIKKLNLQIQVINEKRKVVQNKTISLLSMIIFQPDNKRFEKDSKINWSLRPKTNLTMNIGKK